MPVIFESRRRKRARLALSASLVILVAGGSGTIGGWFLAGHARSSHRLVGQASQQVASAPLRAFDTAATLPPISAIRVDDLPVVECSVVDGDTLHCQGERVRLLGVDAPELPGHCRPGRACVSGDPFAASEALESIVSGRHLRIARGGADRYGRTLANLYDDGRNVSCELLAKRTVQYVAKWDDGGIVAQDCQNL